MMINIEDSRESKRDTENHNLIVYKKQMWEARRLAEVNFSGGAFGELAEFRKPLTQP